MREAPISDLTAGAALPQSVGGRAAPTWLWVVTVLVVIVMTALRVEVFSSLDLRTDEAYYWTWSQQWVLSYLDHPPMVAWFVRLGTSLFGDTPFGARSVFMLALPLTELAFADIARRRSGSMTAALVVVLSFEASLNFGVTAVIVEPGIPLLLFAGGLFWALCRLDETGDARWWLLAGAFAGLALLSKYLIVFFAPGLVAYILLAGNRRWLANRWFWAGAALALLLSTPVLLWNVRHDWASFRFQFARAGAAEAPSLSTFGEYFATAFGFAGVLLAPVIVCAAVVAFWRGWAGRDALLVALAIAFLAPFLYLAERSLHLSVNPSWAIVMWPFGITALAILVGRSRHRPTWLGRFAGIGIATGLPVAAALLIHGLMGNDVWLGAKDPIGADAGYRAVADRVLAEARAHGATWIATSDYRTYAALRWQLWREIEVVEVVERSRFLDFAPPNRAAIDGHPGLYVYGSGNRDSRVEVAIAGHVQPLGSIDRLWRGTVMGSVGVELIESWTPPLDAPPGSPFFAWPNLG